MEGQEAKKPYRFRGMATHPDARKKGFASAMLKRSFEVLKQKGSDLVWCNARVVAVSLYEALGMKIASDEFDIPNIGPHYVMMKEL